VNPHLVACLIPSIAAAVGGAGWCLASGWGWLAALGVYSFGGSAVLLALATLTALVRSGRGSLAARDRMPARVSPVDARRSVA
jgi:hypothetical protein